MDDGEGRDETSPWVEILRMPLRDVVLAQSGLRSTKLAVHNDGIMTTPTTTHFYLSSPPPSSSPVLSQSLSSPSPSAAVSEAPFSRRAVRPPRWTQTRSRSRSLTAADQHWRRPSCYRDRPTASRQQRATVHRPKVIGYRQHQRQR